MAQALDRRTGWTPGCPPKVSVANSVGMEKAKLRPLPPSVLAIVVLLLAATALAELAVNAGLVLSAHVLPQPRIGGPPSVAGDAPSVASAKE